MYLKKKKTLLMENFVFPFCFSVVKIAYLEGENLEVWKSKKKEKEKKINHYENSVTQR